MKIKFTLCAVLMMVLCQSCLYYEEIEDNPVTQSMYQPVYMSRETLNQSVALQTATPIINSGKIYIKDNLLFVGEKYEGFHVINNANPANPLQIGFIKAPGATDIAIKNNVIYINNATDLVALDYNNTSQTINISKRIENAFPQMLSPDGFEFTTENNQIIVNWTLMQ